MLNQESNGQERAGSQRSQREILGSLEAVLFASGEPITMERLGEAVGVSPGALPMLTQSLNDRYVETGSALVILRLAHQFQMATRPEYAEAVRTAMDNKRNQPLSQAAMEVLTIVAYNQPVTKSFVEHIRGVDSSSVVNALIDKGLLEEAGRLEVPGKPLAYRTTETFLRCFQMTSISQLPPLPTKNNGGQMHLNEIKLPELPEGAVDYNPLDDLPEQAEELAGDEI